VTVAFRVALAIASLAAAASETASVESPRARNPPPSGWLDKIPAAKLPAYVTGEGDATVPKAPRSPSPLFRLEPSYPDGRVIFKVQQAPPWAIAGGTPSTDGLILPPDPDGPSGWILRVAPQGFAVVSLVLGGSLALLSGFLLACSAIWVWRRARRGELTTPKRLWRLLVGLNYRRAVLFVWLVAMAGTTLWAPFKYVSQAGHALGPAPRQSLLLAKNEDEYHLVALDFQRLFAEWVGISAAGGALLVLVRARR
jgi:hypothetical protein